MNHDNFKEVTSEDAKKMTNFPSSTAWANGYNTCLERTNAAELLECLKEAKKELEYHNWQNTYTYNRITNAIKKATDQNK